MKKRILALILIAVVSGVMLLPSPAFAADSNVGGFQLSNSSIGVRVGDYTTLSAYFGSSVDSNVIWSVADGTIAAVDGSGKVTGKKIGQTVVTAQDGPYTASCFINVAYKGIDVSRYQGTIDWATVKSDGTDFAMLRTGYGSENWSVQADPYFDTYYADAKAQGIKVGAYHYSYATSVAMASSEADLCLHVLNGRALDYPVAYDVEDKCQWGLSADTIGQMVQTFCSKLQAAGYKTIVYSYYSFYKAHLTSPLVAQYDTWIAHSTAMTDFSPYTMWQYGQRSVPGVSGSCDVDYSFYDYSGSGGSSTGTGISEPTVPDSSGQTFRCDTTGTYTFGTNKTYNYKITTNDTFTPSVSSSNPDAVSVSYIKRLTDGFIFQLVNHGEGQAVITTTAGNGTSVSFTAVGSATGATVTTTTQTGSSAGSGDNGSTAGTGGTLRCDTTFPYTFGSNSSYIYKIYSASSVCPTAVSSNSSAVTVSYYGKASDGYLFRITNAGTGAAVITTTDSSGASASFTANGTLSVQAPAGIKSDTPYLFSMTKGKTYVFKFTPNSKTSTLYFTTGNGAVIQSVSVSQSGGSYFYKIKAVASGQAGVYAKESGKSVQRLSIVTIS